MRWAHATGSALSLHTVLIGPALQHQPLVLLAWRQALQRGLGPQQGTARLDRVWVEGSDEPVLAQAAGPLRTHAPALALALPAPRAAPPSATLVFDKAPTPPGWPSACTACWVTRR